MPDDSQNIPYLNFQLRNDLERYLVEAREILNKIEWYFAGDPLKVDKLHIDQNVITEQVKESLRGPEDGERRFATEFSQHPLEITQQAKLYELSNNFPERVQTSWSNAVGKNDLRLAIIGAPGSGKSFTTKYTVIQKIDEALDLSRRRVCRLEDIQIPIWVTATELASQKRGSKKIGQPAAALEAIIRGSMAKFKLSEKFFRLLRHKLDLVFDQPSDESHYSAKKHIYLVVDSLDELPEDQEDSFTNISKHLDKPSLQLIVTCRTLQWNERNSWLGFTPKEKVEIAPLTSSQQRKFSDCFFRGKKDLRSTMQGLLDGNPALGHAFTTPLLLTFGCLLHGNRERNRNQAIDESTTYVQLYGLVISRIFDGSWREPSKRPYWAKKGRTETGRHLGLLVKICWELFRKKPEANLFTQDDWTEACRNAKTIEEERDINADDFLDSLEKLGFIVEAGYKQTDPQWSFAHRTFFEFLAARALAKREDWLEIANEHFWFAPEWMECLTFLAGLLDVPNVRKLIEAVRDEHDDIFGSMVFLESKLTGASRLAEINDIRRICDLVILGLAEISGAGSFLKLQIDARNRTISRENIKSSSTVLDLNESSRNYISSQLLEPLITFIAKNNNNVQLRIDAIRILDKVGRASNEAVDVLMRIVTNENNTGQLRTSALEALKWFPAGVFEKASDELIEILIKIVSDDNNHAKFRENAAYALGKTGNTSEGAIGVLMNVVANTDNDYELRQTSATSLGSLGKASDEITDFLMKIVIEGNDERLLAMYAARSLGTLGKASNKVIGFLMNVVANEKNDEFVRAGAGEALFEIGITSDDFIDVLIKSLSSKNVHWLLRSFVQILGEIGKASGEVIDVLMKVTANRENNRILLEVYTLILGRSGKASDEVIDVLMKAVSNENNIGRLRNAAAGGLVVLGKSSDEVIDVLVNAAGNDDVSEAGGAAEDLGKIGKESERVIDVLMKIVSNENKADLVRSKSTEALSKLGKATDEIIEVLTKNFANEKNSNLLRRESAKALGKLGINSEEVIEVLTKNFANENNDEDLRREAAGALGQLYYKNEPEKQYFLSKLRDIHIKKKRFLLDDAVVSCLKYLLADGIKVGWSETFEATYVQFNNKGSVINGPVL